MEKRNLFADFKASKSFDPFDRYKVRVQVSDIVGGIPKDPNLIDGWLKASNKKWTDDQRAAIRDATEESLPEAGEEVTERQSIGFKLEEGKGLYIEGRQIKSMLKENGNVIKDLLPNPLKKGAKGITNFKSKIAEQLFVEEERVYLNKEKPDAIEERPIHVMTRQGPRNSLKRVEIVQDATIEFTLSRRKGNIVPEQAMFAILDYAQSLGLGADRSQGRGKFTVLSVEKLEKLE